MSHLLHTPRRREALAALLGTLAGPVLAKVQHDASPPIRLIVALAAGGPIDIAARGIADALSKALGQPVLIDHSCGDGGNLGAVALLVTEPLVILAHPRFAANDVPGLIATARSRPGRVRCGSGGHGSAAHLAGQLFGWLSESSLLHVPHEGRAAALAHLAAGRTDIVFDGLDAAVGHLRRGKLKALGVTSRERTPLLPQVASVADTLPDYEATGSNTIAVSADVDACVLNALLDVGAKPDVQQRFAALGMRLTVGTLQLADKPNP
jgi:tripartite-type tricarboxylate transporter receptor subunit TctC